MLPTESKPAKDAKAGVSDRIDRCKKLPPFTLKFLGKVDSKYFEVMLIFSPASKAQYGRACAMIYGRVISMRVPIDTAVPVSRLIVPIASRTAQNGALAVTT